MGTPPSGRAMLNPDVDPRTARLRRVLGPLRRAAPALALAPLLLLLALDRGQAREVDRLDGAVGPDGLDALGHADAAALSARALRSASTSS